MKQALARLRARHLGLTIALSTLFLTVALAAPAATIWTGATFTYDSTQASGPDVLTPNVALTRGSRLPLYNSAKEGGFSFFVSPMDTEWAFGTLDQIGSLTFMDWSDVIGGGGLPPGPRAVVGQPLVLHLISDDIYLSFTITSWAQGQAGGAYTYDRSTPGGVAPPPPSVTITNPAGGAVFAAPAGLHLGADASVNGGTVTNVEFFGNGVSLGSVQSSPFTLTTAGLSAAAYTLTAVATAGGVSAASAPVNITVVNPALVLLSSPAIVNGQISFSYSASPGLGYVVQRSTDLSLGFFPVVTNFPQGTPVPFSETVTTNGARFYRVSRLPNP